MTTDGIEPAAEQFGLADQLKTRTWSLHREAERSGILQDLLRGRAGQEAYVLLLRNLLPAYDALERELARAGPVLGELARPEIYRAGALRSDLHHLAGRAWAETIPLLASAARYARRIEEAAATDPILLMPHAYVRYLGDLNGGQILKRLLGESLGLEAEALSFYDFPAIADIRLFAADYRAAIDRTVAGIADVETVLAEASTGFCLNIAVSNAVKEAAALATARPGGDAPGWTGPG